MFLRSTTPRTAAERHHGPALGTQRFPRAAEGDHHEDHERKAKKRKDESVEESRKAKKKKLRKEQIPYKTNTEEEQQSDPNGKRKKKKEDDVIVDPYCDPNIAGPSHQLSLPSIDDLESYLDFNSLLDPEAPLFTGGLYCSQQEATQSEDTATNHTIQKIIEGLTPFLDSKKVPKNRTISSFIEKEWKTFVTDIKLLLNNLLEISNRISKDKVATNQIISQLGNINRWQSTHENRIAGIEEILKTILRRLQDKDNQKSRKQRW